MHPPRSGDWVRWSLPVSDDEFFSEMVARIVEKTGDSGVETGGGKPKAKDKRGLNPLLIIAPIGAQAFDAYSTKKAMKAGGREGNPVISPLTSGADWKLYAPKMAGGLLIGIAADQVARHGHRNAAKVISAINITVPIGVGISNMSKAGK